MKCSRIDCAWPAISREIGLHGNEVLALFSSDESSGGNRSINSPLEKAWVKHVLADTHNSQPRGIGVRRIQQHVECLRHDG